ncbi:DNA primase [Sphingomonas sp. Leaf25]|uniref:DNA primase n=1 Tax=Sphingomonas sp. Leaf25 TaxID=1735692 RepID=UPI0006F2D67A|nr:DNA primase [Sphingomonas sp. Leaf25]KQM98101.1 DNA primase [Sphingomonas sp. Leaf25]
MTLSPQFLDELRARTTLSALVAKSVKLQRSGNEHKACCPFHTEKTPSFWVNDDKGFYHCFGCGAHGDAIRWMTDQRGLPFIDAVKELVAAAGMEMPAQDAQSARAAERAKGLHELMADAQGWFVDRLTDEGGIARDALAKRGIKPETARTFGIGYAPDSRGKLKAALASYGDPMLVESGMLISVEGKEPYDRFRGRLMIPIRDARGRTVAFGGRILGDGEPKYLNSPETPLFDKGRTLYNIDRAQAAARKARRVIAVEGYMDVIALAQAGFDEVVAPLGTALTEHQLERLWRMADCPILCFDGDAAGIKAARRAAERALPLLTPGKSIAIVTIPNGMDPDDLVRAEGAQAFEDLIATRESLSDFLWRMELASLPANAGPDERAAFEHELARLAGTIGHEGIRREYFRTFKDQFFALFGAKDRRLRIVANDMAAAAEVQRVDLVFAFQRAVLMGLMQHVAVLTRHCELIAQLPIVNGTLRRWRDHLIDLAIYRDDLCESLLADTVAVDRQLVDIARRNKETDLAFSFWQRGIDPAVAQTDLLRVIHILVEEHASHRAENAARERCRNDTTERTFADYQQARSDHAAVQARIRDWMDELDEAA